MHVFKYLDNVAIKDEKRTGGGLGTPGSLCSEATLRRNVSNPTHSLKLNGAHANSINNLLDQRKKQSLDGGGVTGRSLEHIDKQCRSMSQDDTGSPKWSPMHSTKASISETSTPVNPQSAELSPVDEKAGLAPLSNMQTYREYKEALRQQRNQDTSAVYRSKENTSSSGSSNEASPMSPVNGNRSLATDVITIKPKVMAGKEILGERKSVERETSGDTELDNSKHNNNNNTATLGSTGGYVKPASPMAVTKNGGGGDSTDALVIKSIMNGNGKAATTGKGTVTDNNGKTTGGGSVSAGATKNPKRTVSWNRDIVTPEKNISFTMRREFDRHKEEAELMGKLRNVSIWTKGRCAHFVNILKCRQGIMKQKILTRNLKLLRLAVLIYE